MQTGSIQTLNQTHPLGWGRCLGWRQTQEWITEVWLYRLNTLPVEDGGGLGKQRWTRAKICSSDRGSLVLDSCFSGQPRLAWRRQLPPPWDGVWGQNLVNVC